MAMLEPDLKAVSSEDLKYGIKLYTSIVKAETDDLTRRGVLVLIAYHGVNRRMAARHLDQFFTDRLTKLCSGSYMSCLSLDEALVPTHASNFFPDGHWNENGHKVVSDLILNHLSQLLD